MSGKVFLDTTKLEKIRTKLICMDIVFALLFLLSWKVTGHSIAGFIMDYFIEEICMFQVDTHPALLFLYLWLGLLLACTLQIITLQAWIRTIEDAQQYHVKNKE